MNDILSGFPVHKRRSGFAKGGPTFRVLPPQPGGGGPLRTAGDGAAALNSVPARNAIRPQGIKSGQRLLLGKFVGAKEAAVGCTVMDSRSPFEFSIAALERVLRLVWAFHRHAEVVSLSRRELCPSPVGTGEGGRRPGEGCWKTLADAFEVHPTCQRIRLAHRVVALPAKQADQSSL